MSEMSNEQGHPGRTAEIALEKRKRGRPKKPVEGKFYNRWCYIGLNMGR